MLDSSIADLKTEAQQVINNLLEQELVCKSKTIFGSELEQLITDHLTAEQGEEVMRTIAQKYIEQGTNQSLFYRIWCKPQQQTKR